MMYVTQPSNDVDTFIYFDGWLIMASLNKNIRFFISIFLLCPGLMSGQNFYFNQLTVDDGLSQNSVVSITQDNLGMMWMATQDGLNRYNGIEFEKFNYFFTDITQTHYSQLGKVYSDEYEQLWVSPLDKTALIRNGITESWDTISIEIEMSCFLPYNHSMLIGTYNKGLFEYSYQDRSLTPWPDAGLSLYAMTEFEGIIYISSEKGLITVDQNQKVEILLPPLSDHQFSDIVISKNGGWISTYGKGLFNLSEGQLNQDTRIPTDANIQDLHIDQSGNLWVATYGDGLYLLSENVHHFRKDNRNKQSIGYDDILCIFESKNGILWFGSDGGGVSYIDPTSFKFSSLTVEMVPEDINVEVVRSISVSENGTVWMGTSGLGLTSYRPSDGKLQSFKSVPGNPGTLSGDRIVSLFHDKNQKLWIGTQESGLNIMYPSGKISQIENFPATTIWFIHPSSSGDTLLIGTRNEGLILSDLSGKVLAQYDLESNKNMTSNNLRAITPIDETGYYLGTEDNGIFKFDINDRKFSILEVPPDASEIKSLHYQDEKLWIGTAKNGIVIWNTLNSTFQVFNDTHGLPNNVVYSIVPVTKDEYWISTNSGICRIKSNFLLDIDPLSFQCFSTNDGLQGMEFNTGAWYKHNDGNIYFGGLNGINWFNPVEIRKDSITGQPLIESITINNEDYVGDTSVYYLNHMDLSHDQDFININYFSPDYSNRKSTEYAYRLIGLTDSWTYTGTQQVAGFTNIPPGEYRFQVCKVWNDEAIPETIKELSISIIPAYWQTWWFKSLLTVLILGGISYGYKRRTQYLKDQKEMAEQIKELEMLVLRSQMNPHFIFNSLNSIKSYIIKADRVKASEYISDFAHMMRMILQNSRESEITLEQELESLKLYVELEKMRFKQEVNVQYFIDAGINLDAVYIPPLLLQPYVENAIWHGLMPKEGKKELTISILKIDNTITCRIEDNGIGRDASRKIASQSKKRYKSLGMGITGERIRLHNKVSSRKIHINVKDKIDTEGIPTGTLVNVNIPLNDPVKEENF
ncbi:MAG: histidine kinase [Saprospiraceae bacterium]|nr:histidine kinase [Saprospiraceae bacterium]